VRSPSKLHYLRIWSETGNALEEISRAFFVKITGTLIFLLKYNKKEKMYTKYKTK
jgi:hypothetical protein